MQIFTTHSFATLHIQFCESITSNTSPGCDLTLPQMEGVVYFKCSKIWRLGWTNNFIDYGMGGRTGSADPATAGLMFAEWCLEMQSQKS